MSNVSNPLKIGPISRARLAEIGIRTIEDLQRRGSVEVYVEVKRRYPEHVTLNLLYGLEAILLDVHWTKIPPSVKRRLRSEVDAALRNHE